MTVRDIFALRKQGKIEEAYEAIRPICREHKGKYTTLCMFWTASDVFKLRLEQGRVEEAEKIYKALQRLIPSDNPSEGLNPCDPGDSCSQEVERFSDRFSSDFEAQRPTNEKETICDIRAICVTEKPAASDISAISALSARQEKVLDCIKSHPGLKVPGIEAETGIPAKSIERHIKVLIERNLIEHRGSKKTGGYHAM